MTTAQKILDLSTYLINELNSNDIRFTEELDIKGPNGTLILICRGVATDNLCRIWTMNRAGNWYQVKPGQIYADMILEALIKKLKTIV